MRRVPASFRLKEPIDNPAQRIREGRKNFPTSNNLIFQDKQNFPRKRRQIFPPPPPVRAPKSATGRRDGAGGHRAGMRRQGRAALGALARHRRDAYTRAMRPHKPLIGRGLRPLGALALLLAALGGCGPREIGAGSSDEAVASGGGAPSAELMR